MTGKDPRHAGCPGSEPRAAGRQRRTAIPGLGRNDRGGGQSKPKRSSRCARSWGTALKIAVTSRPFRAADISSSRRLRNFQAKRSQPLESPQESAPDSFTNGNLITRHKLVAISVIAAVVAAVGALWFVLLRSAKPPAELVERRITFNSSANPIESAAISPDGKYLAYSDSTGIHVRLLSTGEERLIPTPGGVSPGLTRIDSWFPNGTELLAHSREADGHGSMWAVSIMGGSSRELRGDAAGWEVSPDGTRIAFSPSGTGFGRGNLVDGQPRQQPAKGPRSARQTSSCGRFAGLRTDSASLTSGCGRMGS